MSMTVTGMDVWKAPARQSSASLIDRRVGAQVVSKVDLTRTGNFLFRVQQHLFPLGDPAAGAWDRKQNREHRHGESHGLINKAGIKVDIGIELAGDEVVIFQGDAFA